MAVTYTFAPENYPSSEGQERLEIGLLTMTGTYTNPSGDVLPASLFRMARVDYVEFVDAVTTAGAIPRYIKASNKIALHGGAAAGAVVGELTGGATVTGTVRVVVHGTGL